MAESVSGFEPCGRCLSPTYGIELRAGHLGPRPRQRCADWLIFGDRHRAGEHVARDSARIALLAPGDNSNGSATAGDWVTANPMVQVPSGVYARMMEGGVYLVGDHTSHKGMVSQVHPVLRRSSAPRVQSAPH